MKSAVLTNNSCLCKESGRVFDNGGCTTGCSKNKKLDETKTFCIEPTSILIVRSIKRFILNHNSN